MKLGFFFVLAFSAAFFLSGSLAYADATITTTDTNVETLTFGRPDGVSRTWIGQSFVATESGTISSVTGATRVQATPVDEVRIVLFTNSAGSPGSGFATTTSVSSGTLTSTCSNYAFTFASPPSVTSGTTYWLVWQRTGSLDGTNYYYACGEDTGATYGTYKPWDQTSGWGGAAALVARFVFTITSAGGGTALATSTPLDMGQQEFLFIFGLATFMFSIPFWDRVFSITRGHYDV